MSVALLQTLDVMRRRIDAHQRTVRRVRITTETYPGQLIQMPIGAGRYDIWIHPADWDRMCATVGSYGDADDPAPPYPSVFGIPVYKDEPDAP